ncbi:extracellular solute-binding protein [Kribbella sp. NPDC059898]|uniref:extracellular solute-binding protein n=1 Tax=Kribbella sp. NPDC059898 TaxID=3346995 RepID=UPI003646B074
MNQLNQPTLGRRSLLKAGVLLAGAGTATSMTGCALGAIGNAGSKKLFVRSTAGAREDVMRKYVWPQFTKETGAEIVPVTANTAKMVAMLKSGSADLDVVDTGGLGIGKLRKSGGLLQFEMDRFKRFKLADIRQSAPDWLSQQIYSEVLVYNTKQLNGAAPASWADFWDVKAFPGRRVLEDAAGEKPPLEQALIADGVALDALYPLDVDRAFRVLEQIKPHILKFWTSGSENESLFSTGQAALGQGWSPRMAALAHGGLPLRIVWAGAGNAAQCLAINKATANKDLAYSYVDFMMSPEVNAEFSTWFPGGPGNRVALGLIKDRTRLADFGNADQYKGKVFDIDISWWDANMAAVLDRWARFVSA